MAESKALTTSDPAEEEAGSDQFFRLLATDNGKGVARMLTDYPAMFGRKTISKALVYPTGAGRGPCIGCDYSASETSRTNSGR